MVQIIPTLFATTEEEFKKRLDKILSSPELEGGWVQFDVMDNKFVHNQSLDLDLIKKYSIPFKKEGQLMVLDPQNWISKLLELQVERIIFPIEADCNPEQIISKVKENNIAIGVSLNPETSLEKLEPYLEKIDTVLFMSVTPGLEGQSFHPETLEKIRNLKQKSNIMIEVDGGIKDTNVKDLINAGADYLAIGSFLFEGDFDENLEKIWEAVGS